MSKLLKSIFRLIFIGGILCIVIFIFLSLWRGGDWLRNTGEFLYRASQEASKISDNIYNYRKGAERFCQKVQKTVTGVFKKDGDSDKGK